MKVIRIVFSPTGGTRQVAEIITSQWNGIVDEVDLTSAKIDFSAINFAGEDIVVIAVPFLRRSCT